MNDTRVALLIDADNLSGDVIEQAIEHLLKLHGAIHFRRAYCSPQKVVEHIDLFRRHSIRPMVNVPTGKNSTDIALAVDAIDLAITERPGVVVIGSSDSDYAPLAQRLREKGCRVLGIGQAGKTGGESPLAYDEFIDLAHRKAARAAPRATAAAAPRRTTAAAAPVTAPARSRGQPVRARTPAPAAPPPAGGAAAPVSPEVASILQAVPALRSGAAIQLNEVGDALRHHALLKSKSASPSRFLKRHATHFELAPADKPRTVRYLGARNL
ncbi:MAG: NYN domain-containing protein [Burkholderiales bacterium]|nr:NYN domain-containing protein [Burkholderiales bacterium]